MSTRDQVPVIAIDGPAGAGKSTASRRLAERLGFFLLDTGALYRCIALAARQRGIDWQDGPRLGELAGLVAIEFTGDQRVLLDRHDVSTAIRTPEMSEGASRVSALPEVRAALLELQRRLAARGGCVVEGRDIGTVVLPWAPVKVFLTASPEARARRRHDELVARGQASDLRKTLAEILARDERDEKRAVAPLRPAADAIHLDTSDLTLAEVVDELERIARAKLAPSSR